MPSFYAIRLIQQHPDVCISTKMNQAIAWQVRDWYITIRQWPWNLRRSFPGFDCIGSKPCSAGKPSIFETADMIGSLAPACFDVA